MIRLRIREVAEAQDITSAAELARRTGIAFAKANELWKGQFTGNGEGNKRSVGLMTLYRIAKALGVKTSDLYTEDEQLALYAAAA